MSQKHKRWTIKEDKVIRELWPNAPMDSILEKLPDRKYTTIKVRAQVLKIKRNPRFFNAAKFKPKRVYKRIKEGLVTIVNYNGNDYCTLYKDGKQIFYHRWVWEKKYGTIPDGYLLKCKTKDTANPNPDNWCCIKKSELALMNVNREKANQALEKWAKEHGGRPAQVLTDRYVATILSSGDPQLKKHILEHEKELIKVARLHYKLNREINHASNQ